jgi:hypothetical protein
VSDHIFLEIEKNACFWRNVMESTGFFCKIVFLAEDYGLMTEFSAKFVETGYLTCDFLGDVEG